MANMNLTLSDGTTITLNADEQTAVYDFYRLHCTKERIIDIIDEKELNLKFNTPDDLIIVTNRVLNIMNDYHISEDDAIMEILQDNDYINKFTHIA